MSFEPAENEQVYNIPVRKIRIPKNCPFSHSLSYTALRDSILKYGVMSPVIVRITGGEPELVCGYHRLCACRQLNMPTIPCLIRDYTDDEAALVMVDSAVAHENIRPTDLAKAYKLKYDILKTSPDESIRKQIRLTKLIPVFANMVDNGTISLDCASETASLSETEQIMLADVLQRRGLTPSPEMVRQLVKESYRDRLTLKTIDRTAAGYEKALKRQKENRHG